MAAVAVALILATVLVPFGGTVTPAAADPLPCQPDDLGGFSPADLASRYGLTDLAASGADGAGTTIVVLEWGETFDPDVLDSFLACNGVTAGSVHTTLIGAGPTPAVGSEAMADLEVIASLVPAADIYVLVATGDQSLATMIDAALDPANTGGQPVDVISSSFGECEAHLSPTEKAEGDAALERMAAEGVWFLKSSGDEGSSECVPKGTCPPVADATASVEYPTSNPNVTGVGGTQVDSASVHGTPSVWHQHGEHCGGGGGGASALFDLPAFQQGFGLDGQTMRMLPDVSALAGSPGYQFLAADGTWTREGGTSLAAPTYAAGLAMVRSALRLHGMTPPASLNQVLYQAASDPVWYPLIFDDVIHGDNDVLGVGCCTATTGYDMASGLGELNVSVLAQWMIANHPTPAPAPPLPVAPSDDAWPLPVAAATAVTATPRFTG